MIRINCKSKITATPAPKTPTKVCFNHLFLAAFLPVRVVVIVVVFPGAAALVIVAVVLVIVAVLVVRVAVAAVAAPRRV